MEPVGIPTTQGLGAWGGCVAYPHAEGQCVVWSHYLNIIRRGARQCCSRDDARVFRARVAGVLRLHNFVRGSIYFGAAWGILLLAFPGATGEGLLAIRRHGHLEADGQKVSPRQPVVLDHDQDWKFGTRMQKYCSARFLL
mgnify:CR=1 FL=1